MTVAFLFHNSEIEQLLASWGYAIVFLIVGAESVGIPMPGETALTLAALYAGTTHRLSIVGVVAAAAAGAIVGDNVGYTIGRIGGYRLLRR
ncbi:MAG: DedA family protein, partial [Acidobacteriota bacterium]|nr:DedA family protein [Acidobacteriota bacterium]